MNRLLGVLLLVALIGGAGYLIGGNGAGDADTGGTDAGPATGAKRFADSASCRECHPKIFAEWEQSQHAIAFTNPLVRRADMADGFRKKDCIPCHAPRPVFEHGLGKAARVLTREAHQYEGVDCLSCHETGAGQASATADAGATFGEAPCRPVFRAELRSTDLCAPCHNQHLTVDRWEVSPVHLKGDNCLHCHMPPVERRRADGTTYTGAFHGSRGGNDLELLRRAATVTATIEDGGESGARFAKVVVANTGCAHNLPTDARHRAVDLVIERLDATGAPLPGAVDDGPGQRGGHARARYRNPYRDEYGVEDTQIPAGESRELSLPVADAASIRVRLLYKRTPFVEDAEAAVMFEQRLTPPTEGGP